MRSIVPVDAASPDTASAVGRIGSNVCQKRSKLWQAVEWLQHYARVSQLRDERMPSDPDVAANAHQAGQRALAALRRSEKNRC
jgi:hypothetical protein